MDPLYKPENTAIARPQRSAPALQVLERIVPELHITKLLDYGCGRGADVRWYKEQRLDAEGFDPYVPFGFSRPPTSTFPLVTCVFVLNVLSDWDARRNALVAARRYVSAGGHLLVVARSAASIEREAATHGWSAHQDGWWSNRARGTFQHGLTHLEIIELGNEAGLSQVFQRITLRLSQNTVWALLKRMS